MEMHFRLVNSLLELTLRFFCGFCNLHPIKSSNGAQRVRSIRISRSFLSGILLLD
jgi:hypothetical protein